MVKPHWMDPLLRQGNEFEATWPVLAHFCLIRFKTYDFKYAWDDARIRSYCIYLIRGMLLKFGNMVKRPYMMVTQDTGGGLRSCVEGCQFQRAGLPGESPAVSRRHCPPLEPDPSLTALRPLRIGSHLQSKLQVPVKAHSRFSQDFD